MNTWRYFLIVLTCIASLCPPVHGQEDKKRDTSAIVFATFGTSVPSALQGILHIKERIQAKYPQTEVRLAFTSNMVRAIWHKRQTDENFIKENPSIAKEIFSVKGPLATIADLQDEGYTTIIVQSGHISLGEEYLDLAAYIEGLKSIATIKTKNRPFVKLVLGRPALGTMGPDHPFSDDITAVAKSLTHDVQSAAEHKAALVYLAHGNEFFPSSGAYLQLAQAMNTLYTKTKTYITTVEGFPSPETTIRQLQKDGIKKVLLKPLMIVAGDHALNDMAGDEPSSVKSILKKNGIETLAYTEGLGEQDDFADIFVRYIAEAAHDSDISLH